MGKDYQLNTKILADIAKAARSALGKTLQLQSVKQNAQASIDKKCQECYQPINQKARAAIEAVVQAKGYDYVVDDQTGQFPCIRKTTNDLLVGLK